MTVGQGMTFGLVFMVGLGTLASLAGITFGRALFGPAGRKTVLLILLIPVYLFLVWVVIALGLLAAGAW